MTMADEVFVILAAGAGTRIGRVGESLHKALVPIGGKAVVSHLFDLRPQNSRVVIVLGHRGNQIREYVSIAHPQLDVDYVEVEWDAPGAGPGASLYATRAAVGEDVNMTFTSCDTMWQVDHGLWKRPYSWAALSAIPAGTDPARWCRMHVDENHFVTGILDKEAGGDSSWLGYTGLSRIISDDLTAFWDGLMSASSSHLREGEKQVTSGFYRIPLHGERITWIDVGDEQAYRDAVARMTGYDFTKINEATYVLPDEGRVIKFWANQEIMKKRHRRAVALNGAVPDVVGKGEQMFAYHYVPGRPVYDMNEPPAHMMQDVLEWGWENIWRKPAPVPDDPAKVGSVCMEFYRTKTYKRISMLSEPLQSRAMDAVSRIDWHALCAGAKPGLIHGDFNFGNIIYSQNTETFLGIDWREDFGGEIEWGDIRYDLAKLAGGTRVHWMNAQRGDFRPWAEGEEALAALDSWTSFMFDDQTADDIQLIAALQLLNSAPLHAAPLDEILVARGAAWLGELT